ncbi:MAG: citramalate synthase [Planctomycetales bacterium 4484_123]|nr:MAG: citramalate synthase [Planctomycetales bacterium 4484_123]
MSKKPRVLIYDTTLRDGTQAQGVSLSLEDKLMIAEKLDELGVDYIEGGYPLSNPKDKAFFEAVRRRPMRHARVAAFGMTRRKNRSAASDEGMRALLASEAPVVTIVGKSWLLHVRDVLRATQKENLAMIADSVALMVRSGRETIFDAEHFFDGYADNPGYAMKTLAAAAEGGASCLVLCDTNGGSLPQTIGQVTAEVVRAFPGLTVGIHCHNDSDLAVANTLAAVAAGARHVQGTVNGIGERCGNADLISVVANLVLKCGLRCLRSSSLGRLTELSRFVYEVANLQLRDNQPYVGISAFAHKGGMHVHAVRRNTASYEHIPPQTVGNRRQTLISELAGATTIAAKARRKFHIDRRKDLQRKVLAAVQNMENEGYQFEAADASFELLIRRTLGGKWYRRFWELDHYRCVILQMSKGQPGTEAIVKLSVNGQPVHTVAEGDGPVNALDGALRKALQEHYPAIDELHLVDYKVRVVNPRAGTAARVRVVIEFQDQRLGYFGTVGVDENIIHASWQALTDAIEYKLLNMAEAKRAGR